MKLFHTVQGIRDAVSADRRDGKRIGFVPTMGNLHQGHLQLVTQARQSCDLVVVSIFVNPLQFGLNEDWETYPRTLESDALKLESVGCDYLFNPTESEIYPNGMADQTRVVVPTMIDVLCGASRPGHFEGVTTVVSKLFHIVQPDEAVFGIKDYQQLAVIRRMTEDLCIPVKVAAAPIARDSDGLALSSRNSFIDKNERPNANCLYRALCWVAEQIRAGERDFHSLEQRACEQLQAAGFKPDYLVVSHAKTLEPAACDDTELVVLGAMYARNARLIDNVALDL